MTAVNTGPLSKFELSISPDQMENFFQAVQWRLPDRPQMPPTLATVFRKGEFDVMATMGIALQKVLHAEQEYRFHKALEPGKVYTGTTSVKHSYEKQGTKNAMNMKFYILQTALKDEKGNLCVESLTTIVVREPVK